MECERKEEWVFEELGSNDGKVRCVQCKNAERISAKERKETEKGDETKVGK